MLPLSVVPLPHHPKDAKEEVQNVQVKGDGSPYVLIVGESLDQIVRVVDDVSREDNCADTSVDSNRCRSQWEEHLHFFYFQNVNVRFESLVMILWGRQ